MRHCELSLQATSTTSTASAYLALVRDGVGHALACVRACVRAFFMRVYCGRALLEDSFYDPPLPQIAVGKPLHGTLTSGFCILLMYRSTVLLAKLRFAPFAWSSLINRIFSTQ